MIQKRQIIFLISLFLVMSFSSLSAQDATDDKLMTYEEQKAVLHEGTFRFNPVNANKMENDIPYQVFFGNGDKTKLSLLAEKMESPVVARNLKWGEAFPYFAAGLTASILTMLSLDIAGAICISVYWLQFSSNNTYGYTADAAVNYAGITLFALSGLGLAGIIVFAVLFAKSARYRLNYLQAQSIVKQYNTFLKRKLGIPLDMDINYNVPDKKIGLLFSYQL